MKQLKYRPWTHEEAIGKTVRVNGKHLITGSGSGECSDMLNLEGWGVSDADTLLKCFVQLNGEPCGVQEKSNG